MASGNRKDDKQRARPSARAGQRKAGTASVSRNKAPKAGGAASASSPDAGVATAPPQRKPSARRPRPGDQRSELTPAEPTTASVTRRSERPSSVPRPEPGSILVTGICGRLGRLLARQLHREHPVVGIDRRPFEGKPKDIVHHQFDVRRKKTRDIFRTGTISAVVHLGVLHDPRASDKEHHSWNVVAFQKLLEYLTQYEVPKLVVLSSANVYGPQADNPQFLTEEAPLLGAQHFRGIRDLVELDMLAQSFFWRHPKTETVILRPCHILGSVRNAPSNYLRLERPVSLLGFDPMVQVIHERDVVDAIKLALEPGVRGIFNLRGPGELPLSHIFRMLGRSPLPLPGTVAHLALERLWKLRMISFPPPELDHIRYVCMVDDTRAREGLGFAPRHSMAETVRSVDSER